MLALLATPDRGNRDFPDSSPGLSREKVRFSHLSELDDLTKDEVIKDALGDYILVLEAKRGEREEYIYKLQP